MDGIVPSGAVSPAEFALATAADDEEIRGLLRAVPMQGRLRIGFSREPSYFACRAPAGIEERTLLARRDGRLISVGAWSLREVWLRGEPVVAGYLHGLRMASGTAGSMGILRAGYLELARQVGGTPAQGWFTSVAADNARARRVFESRAGGLPRYRRMTEYLTRVVPVPRRGGVMHEARVESRDELTGFLQREGARHDLALTWDEARWRALEQSGFTADDVVEVRRGGRIVAAAGVWNQSSWKQVVVDGYPRWLRCMRPIVGLGAACLGWPGLPAQGGRVPLAPVFPFAVAEGWDGVMPDLWRGLEAKARSRGIAWLALGLDSSDSLWQRAGRAGISYRTILYSVGGGGFPDRWLESGERMFRPECATL
jgi:hypothetical protein